MKKVLFSSLPRLAGRPAELWCRLFLGLACYLLGAAALAAPRPAARPRPADEAAAPTAAKTILGVYVGNNAADVKAFEDWLGKPVDGVLGYTSMNREQFVAHNGGHPGWQINPALPYLGSSGRRVLWSIPMIPEDTSDPTYMQEVARGERNDQFADWAQNILAARQNDNDPIYVRTAWEVGGEWFAYTGAAKADPAGFRQAFQQFAKSFHGVSSRFKMVWDFAGDRPLAEQWYPGDEATDVISQDIYWQPQYQGSDPTVAFNKAVNSSGTNGYRYGLAWMTDFAAKHGKPMAISEWGVPGTNGNTYDGATFINLMKQWIETHNVVYANYWDSESSYNGLLRDNDPSATATALRNFFLSGTSSSPTPPTPPVTLRAPENPASTAAGLHYAYYEATGLSALPDFTKLTPAASGTVATPGLAPRQRDDDFAFRYSGFVTVPTDGTYTFYTTSDDGSRLYIGEQLVVDNDGLHGAQEKSGPIGLKAGTHALTVTFFERGGDQVLSVSYAGPGLSKQPIPATAFSYLPAPAPPATPTADIISGGTYRLVARHSGKALDVDANSLAQGAKVQQWDILNPGPAQAWVIDLQGDGAYTLTHQNTNQRLDVSGNSPADGGTVWQYTANDSDAQRWLITPTDSGYYKLVHQGTANECLDVAGGPGATADGVKVQQWKYVGGLNQQWKLERLDNAATSVAASTTARLATTAAASSSAELSPTAAGPLAAYPNPSSGAATLTFAAARPQQVTVYVYDAQGHLATLLGVPAQAGRTDFALPGSLPPGTYHLRATIDGQHQQFTLRVE